MRTHVKDRLTGIVFVTFVVLALAGPAYANPLGPDPANFAAWIVVVTASLLLEVFVTTGFLFVAGIAVVPMFFALVLGNVITYVGIAVFLYETVEIAWLVEAIIVVIEAAFIKLLSSFDLFQGDSFDGLKWRVAFLSTLVGNACSYYVGTLLA